MDAPAIIAIPIAVAAAIIVVFGAGVLCAFGFALLGLRSMARTSVRALSDTWRRWKLRAWWNRANRFRYRKHARDLNGLRCPADIPADEGVIDSKTVAALRRRAGA